MQQSQMLAFFKSLIGRLTGTNAEFPCYVIRCTYNATSWCGTTNDDRDIFQLWMIAFFNLSVKTIHINMDDLASRRILCDILYRICILYHSLPYTSKLCLHIK